MQQILRASIAILLASAATLAHADAGLPMLALTWPAQWLALVPIIGIEAAIISHRIGKPFRGLLWPVAKANLISTLVGVPIAWAVMLIIEFVVAMSLYSALPQHVTQSRAFYYLLFPFNAAWVAAASPWEIPAAFLVLAIPFCVISVYIEFRSLRASLPDSEPMNLKRTVWLANLATYGLLVLLALLFPLVA